MARYMFLIRGACNSGSEQTPEQMQEQMQAWMDWMKQGTDDGWLLDPGSGLTDSGAVVQADLTVRDGPFTESKELVGGYSIVEAPDLSAACELAKRTMEIAGSGHIEVREIANPG